MIGSDYSCASFGPTCCWNDPCAANATDDSAMRKTAASDRIRFMVCLFSVRFEETERMCEIWRSLQVPRRVCTILTHAGMRVLPSTG